MLSSSSAPSVAFPQLPLLRNLEWPALRAELAGHGVGESVARKVFARVHRDWGSRLDDMEALPAKVRAALAGAGPAPELVTLERRRAADGFVKYLFRLPDGAEIEAVRIPLPDPAAARALKERRQRGEAHGLVALPTAKYSLCISSQVGCALGCAFCATGKLGLSRNLANWEMLAQVHAVLREADHPALFARAAATRPLNSATSSSCLGTVPKGSPPMRSSTASANATRSAGVRASWTLQQPSQ